MVFLRLLIVEVMGRWVRVHREKELFVDLVDLYFCFSSVGFMLSVKCFQFNSNMQLVVNGNVHKQFKKF